MKRLTFAREGVAAAAAAGALVVGGRNDIQLRARDPTLGLWGWKIVAVQVVEDLQVPTMNATSSSSSITEVSRRSKLASWVVISR